VAGGEGDSRQVEEVRLAMGWNGGVSLAVWMGGVAAELDCARRAYLGPESDTRPARAVYHSLCAVFRRRLVLDLFAGASAGGLNSALLGAAIHTRRRLHPDFLRRKWLDLGDFAGLLQPTNQPEPKSIMRGELFADAMSRAFVELMRAGTAVPDLCALPPGQEALEAFRPPLDIQVTSVLGEQRGFVDAWGRELIAREYRTPFKFRSDPDYDPATLAAAARASASFPAAFEPFKIEGDSLRVAGLSGLWRYAIDGGLLENAPIRQAIELIPTRPASGPVKRFICYVNANPPRRAGDSPDPQEPGLKDVLGYVVNLPRIGRDIDQLHAITDAARRGAEVADTEAALLSLPQPTLVATAAALFEPYRSRRALASLEEVLATPTAPASFEVIAAVLTATNNGALLPWLPASPETPTSGAEWRWGFRAAQRVLYLELDVLARALRDARASGAYETVSAIVYQARQPIDAAIQAIGAAHERFLQEPGLRERTAGLPTSADMTETLTVLDAIIGTYRDDDIFAPLSRATGSFYQAVGELVAADASPYPPEQLFGTPSGAGELSPAQFGQFLERALAIEVVRRAFVDDQDIDALQTLSFVQLAPNAGVRIFTQTPVSATGPADGEDKLTGIRLGHFAGFYRRSWRANDFMWGRLDAAARIVDLLVDPDWAKRLPPDAEPWLQLAATLVPDGTDLAAQDQRRLVHEALTDAQTEAEWLSADVATLLAATPLPSPGDTDPLRRRLSEAIKADLNAQPLGTRGFLTRVLCARAAQYEILRAELPVLVAETRGDRDLGCGTAPLTWSTDGSLQGAIAELRNYQGDNSLPRRLGRDVPDESTSTLALRTVSHAILVTLAALPGISMPLARLFVAARPPFLAIAGIVARSLLANLAVIVSFGAAAFYLTGRIITSDNNGKHPVLLGELVSPPVWAMGLTAAAALGVLVVPWWRTARRSRKTVQAASALALTLSAGLIAVIAGIATIGTAQTLTGSGGFNPGRWTIGLTFLGAGIGIAGVRQLSLAGKLIAGIERRRTWATSLIISAVAGLLLGWSSTHIIHALNDGGWHTAAAIAALASMPLLAAYTLINKLLKSI
jgi:predicted acylesterase/phospholipase RssA